jgi:RNA polymerase sigma-70 factor (ECF subfamily)
MYDTHAPGVLRAAMSVLGDAAAAEDVVHEVFLDLWRRPDQYDPERGEIGPYLRLKSRSRALDARRRTSAGTRLHDRCVHEIREEIAGEPADPTVAPSVRAAVRGLPPSQREAIALAYWGGLSCREVAEHCGIPLGTAKSRMRLGLARLARDVSLLPMQPASALG